MGLNMPLAEAEQGFQRQQGGHLFSVFLVGRHMPAVPTCVAVAGEAQGVRWHFSHLAELQFAFPPSP